MKTKATKCRGRGALVAMSVTVAALGCSKSAPERVATFPAKGTITFQGQPIPGATVVLNPKTKLENVPTPRANVAPDGTFKVSTFNTGDGAPEGDYVVTVKWYKPVKNGADSVSGPNVIPPKYATPESSDIQIHVAAGENDLKPIKL